MRLRLEEFVDDAGPELISSWERWVPELQREAGALLQVHEAASEYTAILEYELPRDLRRPDVVILESGVVVVLELKGPQTSLRAGLDQVLAYARDLRAYHRECHARPVEPVLVRAMESNEPRQVDGAWIVGPRGVHRLLRDLAKRLTADALTSRSFLAEDSYCPMPTIVQAARELFERGDLPFIKRARACTDPALAAISAIAQEAAETKRRHVVMLTGVPGSGKTLVGLQLVHAKALDDLAVPRDGTKPSVPAAFLSGNGPLVAVLQDALAAAGGGGKTFVQDIKQYVKTYSAKRSRTPPEHLLVFDEAQRAHDAERVAHVHKVAAAQSEPEHLLEFMLRVPEWSVLVALIGDGQAIHVGEERGLPMWREALESVDAGRWIVHAAAHAEQALAGGAFELRWNPALNLDTELRHHLIPRVHEFVAEVVEHGRADRARKIAHEVWRDGHRFLVTSNLELAKSYLRERYGDAPTARYGLVASSKDKCLLDWGVDNSFQTTKQLRAGPWFNQAAEHPLSCCRLDKVATEFVAQGLELDMALLAWGGDFVRKGGAWSNEYARGTRGSVRDPLALRRNSYRVLLTRGRDGTVVFVPPTEELRETLAFLVDAGFEPLS
ncbi:MAG: DUF2075 domain-containing protein [Planctomycetes bacterium]|nr:DUF2075 domain-containing protein [Planctomycetota bacterium]